MRTPSPAASIEQWWGSTVRRRDSSRCSAVSRISASWTPARSPPTRWRAPGGLRRGVAVPEVIMRLYADGCDPKYTAAPTAWPAIQHLTIAQPAPRSASTSPRRPRRLPRRGLRRPHHPLRVRLEPSDPPSQRWAQFTNAQRRIDVESPAEGARSVPSAGVAGSPPPAGPAGDEVAPRLRTSRPTTCDGGDGRAFTLAYSAGPDVGAVAEDAHRRFMTENALNTDAFPSLRRIQQDVVAIVGGWLNGGPEAAGFMTTGGTESILLAVEAARQRGLVERGVRRPNVVLPDLRPCRIREGRPLLRPREPPHRRAGRLAG